LHIDINGKFKNGIRRDSKKLLLSLNADNKSKEMILYRRANYDPPPAIPGIARVSNITVLRVELSDE